MNQNHFFVLTTGIIILALVSGGYSGTPSSSSSSSIPQGTLTESSTQVATETPAATPEPIVEPTAEPTEAWWDEKEDYYPAVVSADENLFGVEIEGIKYDANRVGGGYTMFDENQNIIYNTAVYTPSTLHLEHDLPQEQYEALTDQYGRPEEVIFEKYDSSGDGNLDKVAVRYEGVGGKVLEFETDYRDGAALSGYMYEMIKTKIE